MHLHLPLTFLLLSVIPYTTLATSSQFAIRDRDSDDYRAFFSRSADANPEPEAEPEAELDEGFGVYILSARQAESEADLEDGFDLYSLGVRDAESDFEDEGFLFGRDAEAEAFADPEAEANFEDEF